MQDGTGTPNEKSDLPIIERLRALGRDMDAIHQELDSGGNQLLDLADDVCSLLGISHGSAPANKSACEPRPDSREVALLVGILENNIKDLRGLVRHILENGCGMLKDARRGIDGDRPEAANPVPG